MLLGKPCRSGMFPLHFPQHPQSLRWEYCCVHLHTLFLASPVHLLSRNLPNPSLILLIHLTPQAPVAAKSILSVLKQSPTSLIKCLSSTVAGFGKGYAFHLFTSWVCKPQPYFSTAFSSPHWWCSAFSACFLNTVHQPLDYFRWPFLNHPLILLQTEKFCVCTEEVLYCRKGMPPLCSQHASWWYQIFCGLFVLSQHTQLMISQSCLSKPRIPSLSCNCWFWDWQPVSLSRLTFYI